MIKSNIGFLLSVLVGLLGNSVYAQGYPKDFLTHKVVVNLDDRTIETYVKPVKSMTILADRDYYWFSGKQINNTQGGYGGKLLNGEFKEYDISKGLKVSGAFLRGLKSGVWKSWRENGKLLDDYSWNFGQKDGPYHKYDTLGKVSEFGAYKNDLLQGYKTTMVGDSAVKERYKQGKIVPPKSRNPGFIKRLFK